MRQLRFYILCLFISFIGCNQHQENESKIATNDSLQSGVDPSMRAGKGALLLTMFNSMEELKKVVQIKYIKGVSGIHSRIHRKPLVSLKHIVNGHEISSVLKAGVSQLDFERARDSGFLARVYLILSSPYTAWNRNDLQRVYTLSRRMSALFGEGDVAFYDLAEHMVGKISDRDKANMSVKDLSEKGYLNTFNHFTAQAIVTSIFSENLAEFIADIHERYNMPELISGTFTNEQLADIENGPVDNYVDMINNEWGQAYGEVLKKKYKITRKTVWTNELLENYLNDIEQYFSFVFQIGFEPFRSTDEVVIRFSDKLNNVLNEMPLVI